MAFFGLFNYVLHLDCKRGNKKLSSFLQFQSHSIKMKPTFITNKKEVLS